MNTADGLLRVLLVDDVADIRTVLRMALRLRGGFEVVGEAATGSEAVRRAAELQPDLVVLDLALPDLAGRDVLTGVRERSPASKIVVFTGSDPNDEDWVASEAEGYVVKDAEISHLIDILEVVARPRSDEYLIELPADLASAGRARRFLWASLGGQLGSDLYDDAALVVSELVTNAVTHARSECRLLLSLTPASLRISVADSGPGTPEPQPHSAVREHGRGLQLVGGIATAWGIDTDTSGGKVVWAEVSRATSTV